MRPEVGRMDDLISRADAQKASCEFLVEYCGGAFDENLQSKMSDRIKAIPSAQPEFKPVTVEEFAKTMSENTFYGYMAWHGEAFTFMKEMGFEICKKTM